MLDCDRLGNIDPERVRDAISPRTKAIVATHLWGVPAQIETLATIAEDHGIALIEDGSHADGATVNGRKIGTFGAMSLFAVPHRMFPDLADDWPRYGTGQFPCAEALHGSTLKITVQHDDDALADDYIAAIHIVINNLHDLRR